MQGPKSQISIQFVNHQLNDGVVLYHILVLDQTQKQQWQIKARYSRMREVNQDILESYQNDLPQFPPKKFFGNTDKSFIETRKKALQTYFNTILKHIDINELEALQNFLYTDRQINSSPITTGANSNSSPPSIKKEEEKKEPNDDANQQKYAQEKKTQAVQKTNTLQSRKEEFQQIVDMFSSKFINLADNYNPPDESISKQQKNDYEKLKFEEKSQFFAKYELPQTKQNTIGHLHDDTITVSEPHVVHDVDILAERIRSILFNYQAIDQAGGQIVQIYGKA